MAGPPAPIGRIALASVLVAGLIAVVLAVTVVNYRNAVDAGQPAADAMDDAAAARSAEKYLAREQETVSDAVLGLHPFLTIAGRNADRLLGVAGDLLFVAQVEAGTFSLPRGPADLTS